MPLSKQYKIAQDRKNANMRKVMEIIPMNASPISQINQLSLNAMVNASHEKAALYNQEVRYANQMLLFIHNGRIDMGAWSKWKNASPENAKRILRDWRASCYE